MKQILFDNILFIIIAVIIIISFEFNRYTIAILILLFIANHYALFHLRKNIPKLNMMRAMECLKESNYIALHQNIQPIENKIELLDKPLKEFIINTSHNTYIPCNQNMDVASTEAIKTALLMGARCIELDIFAKNNNKDTIPVVAHGIEKENGDIMTTNYILFENCIDTIVQYGFNNSDPLIICLEVNTNNISTTNNMIKNIIQNKFGDRLLSNRFESIFDQPIKNLLNKVIIITDVDDDNLDKISNVKMKDIINMEHDTNMEKQKVPPNKIYRVYPSADIWGHFSKNYDPSPLWKNGYNMLALNFQNVDDNLNKNVEMFKNYSFIHMSEI